MRTSCSRGARRSVRWRFAGIGTFEKKPSGCRNWYTNLLDGAENPDEIQRARLPALPIAHRQPVFPMMAFDRTSVPRLEAQTIEALRSVMQRAMRKGDHGQELQAVLARAATEAREKEIHAEQLLVIMKDLWYSLPDLRSAEDSDRQTELLQELISRCISQYYAT